MPKKIGYCKYYEAKDLCSYCLNKLVISKEKDECLASDDVK